VPERLERLATYRVQLRDGLTLDRLIDDGIVADLARLGVSHVYLSPVLRAAEGSTHGYDVVDTDLVDPRIGGLDGLRRVATEARAHGMRLMIDIVPNHMAIHPPGNRWWWDVLRNGPASARADAFDIDWHPPEQRLRGVILLPVLPDHVGRELEAGAFSLRVRDGELVVVHPSITAPLEPRSTAPIFAELGALCRDPQIEELARRLRAVPAFGETDPVRVALRRDLIPVLDAVIHHALDVASNVERLEWVLGSLAGDPDRLEALLAEQPYRLARWQSGAQDLTYRRFFDVDHLVALRTDRPAVFHETHRAVREWVDEGLVDGLRVDHPDGLRDPGRYAEWLRHLHPDGWIVVEKILGADEQLPATWPVDGTTGYDAAELISRLFLDDAGRGTLEVVVSRIAGSVPVVSEEVRRAKREVTETLLGADLLRLAECMVDVCERRRRIRDFTRVELHQALLETISSFPVYRSYVTDDASASAEDAARIDEAIAAAGERRPELDPELLDALARILRNDGRAGARAGAPAGVAAAARDRSESELRTRFEQLCAPAMAKGAEDTAWYRILTLISRNEVGSDPSRWELGAPEFHEAMALRQSRQPLGLVALSTHDSKRNETVRCRLDTLSAIADEWSDAVDRWHAHLHDPGRLAPPDAWSELYLLQTMFGAFPLDAERAVEHLIKAARESKQATSWRAPDTEYEAMLERFVRQTVEDPWLAADLACFVRRHDPLAAQVARAWKVLHLTIPGVPDIYQGTERPEPRLVDPDSRRGADWDGLRELLNGAGASVPTFEIITRTLAARRRRSASFGPDGTYRPVWATGPHAERVLAFGRGDDVVVVVLRRGLAADFDPETSIGLTEGTWDNVLDDSSFSGRMSVSDVIGDLGAAVLVRR